MATTAKNTFSGSLMKGDRMLWNIYVTLIIISIVELFSATSSLAYSKATNSDPIVQRFLHLAIGFVAAIGIQTLRPQSLCKWGYIIYVLGIVSFIAMLVKGGGANDSMRDFYGLQPAEFMKVGLLVSLSHLLSISQLKRGGVPAKRLYWMLFLIACVIIPVSTQNLSTAMIIGIASLFTLLLGGVQWKYLRNILLVVIAIGAIGVASLFALHKLNESSIKDTGKKIELPEPFIRMNTWEGRIFDKGSDKPLWEQDRQGKKSQVIHSHMALANSYPSPIGRLPGNSRLRDFLPEADCDYIFAIIFEELGFVGALVVIFLYIALLLRAYALARKCDDLFLKLALISLAIVICTQALIHIGVCTDAMFVTGQPLPMISRGGSSAVLTSCAFGFMFSISRSIAKREAEKKAMANGSNSGNDSPNNDGTADDNGAKPNTETLNAEEKIKIDTGETVNVVTGEILQS